MNKWVLFAALLLPVWWAHGQELIVSGKVVSDETGMPVPAATIRLKGTGLTCISDTAGNYRIGIPGTGAVLVVQALGMLAQEVTPGNTGHLDVRLRTDVTVLGELVITGYKEQSRRETTGAFTTVAMARVAHTPQLSVDKALQGQVPGLQSVGGSGLPGSGQQIRIRGTGSISAGAEPLFVVNGIPVNTGVLARNNANANSLAGIDIQDIEQITVLKDAAAASAYGSRAANGVIVITLKQGKAGKTVFRLSSEAGIVTEAYSNPRNRPLNTAQWRLLTAEGVRNRFPDQYPDEVGALKYVDQSMGINPAVDTDWLKTVTQTGKQLQYHLSATGGSDQTRFYVSTGYLSQTGNVIATGLRRFSGNVALTHTAGKRLTLRASVLAAHTGQYGPDNGGAFSNPVLAAYFLRPSLSPRTSSGSVNMSAPDFPAGGLYNPLAIAALDKRMTAHLKAITSFGGEWQVFPHFKLTSRFGIDYNTIEEDQYNNPFYGDEVNDQGKAVRAYSRYFNWIWNNMASYHRAFGHYDLQVSAGYEAQKSRYYFNQASAYGLPSDLAVQVPSAGAGVQSAEGSNSDYAFVSGLALLDFNYKQKWILSGSLRRDASSRFGTGHRSGIFWSVGLAWQLDQERMLQALTFIDQLKLRASYGFNGNAAIGNYDWQGTYAYGKSYNYLGQTGSGPAAPGNENLTWEFNKPLNVGMDLGVFGQRLTISVDWYTRLTSNLLINQSLPGTSGYSNFKNNAGSVRNRGIEMAVAARLLDRNGWRWEVYGNASWNRNRIVSLPGGRDMVSGTFIRRVGADMQSFYLRQWAGVDPETGAAQWYTDASRNEKTESYNLAQPVLAGTASVKLFGSIGAMLSFKGFILDLQCYYSQGNSVRDAWATYTQSDGANANFNVVAAQLGRWQRPGDRTDVPRYVYGGANASNALSTRFLYRGDYLRLRYATLSYGLPRRALSALRFSAAKVFVRGTNLLTWVADKDLPYDPETNMNSTANFDVFIPKTFTTGVQIDF